MNIGHKMPERAQLHMAADDRHPKAVDSTLPPHLADANYTINYKMLEDIDLTTSDSKEGVHSLLPSNHKCTPSACIVVSGRS